ncbi:MAG: PKD domain-containing protein, partial [Thiotrichaceae bacterium]
MGKIITFVMLLFITNVSLSVGSAQASTEFKLDIDGDGQVEPLTDGLLVLRYLFGFTSDTLIEGATQTTCTRCAAPEIQSYISSGVDSLLLDIDADGTVAPLTDGLLILRYLFGFSGSTLISQAVQQEGSRTEADEIEAYLATLVEGVNINENSPVFNSVSDQTVVAGEVLNVTISATDADGDPLSFSSTTLPTYATLQDNGDNTATLRLAPQVNNVGIDTIAIEVTDGFNVPVSQSIGVTITNVINEVTLDISVNASSDDAEEFSNGSIKLASGDIELVNAQEAGNQTVGIRFTGIQLPVSAIVSKAYLQFKVDEVSSDSAELIVYGEASINPVTFASASNNISSRNLTAANTRWIPAGWFTVGDQSVAQRSSDISNIIQELITQSGWDNGQSMVFIIKGSGRRTAESFDGDSVGAPTLHIEYSDDGNPPPVAQFTTTPISGDVPLEVAFDGSGSSDNTPLTRYTWDFGDGTTTSTSISNTTHTYTTAGSYTVSLTVTDEGDKSDTSTQTDAITATTPSEVVINEILAKNDTGLTDGNGLRHDWIELHNQGGSAADISGWCLTDKEAEPQQWCFPESVSLAAGAYLIVYASKLSAPDITSGEYHAQLKLKNSGEYLALLKA